MQPERLVEVEKSIDSDVRTCRWHLLGASIYFVDTQASPATLQELTRRERWACGRARPTRLVVHRIPLTRFRRTINEPGLRNAIACHGCLLSLGRSVS